MTNTPHDLETSWHAQINKAVSLFGGLSNNPPMTNAFFAFYPPISASSTTAIKAIEMVHAVVNSGASVSAKGS